MSILIQQWRAACCVFLAALAWSAGLALAGTCTWSMSNVAHGAVDVTTGLPADTTAGFSMSCTGWTPNSQVLVCLSFGWPVDYRGNCSGSQKYFGPAASNGFSPINQFYQDAARTILWGDSRCPDTTSYGRYLLTANNLGTANGAGTIYARLIGNQQYLIPGTYTANMGGDGQHWYARQATSASDTCALNTAGETQGPGFTMSATVASICTIISAGLLDFGTSGFITANIDAASALSLRCSNTTPYTIALNGGLTGATNPLQRKMTLGANAVTYGLYQNAARSIAWGDGTSAATMSGTGTGSAQNFNIYGRVAIQATPAPGTYADTIIVTVTY